jgi:hypothetical protein
MTLGGGPAPSLSDSAMDHEIPFRNLPQFIGLELTDDPARIAAISPGMTAEMDSAPLSSAGRVSQRCFRLADSFPPIGYHPHEGTSADPLLKMGAGSDRRDAILRDFCRR